MKVQTYPNRDEALEAIVKEDKTYVFIRHILKPGETIKPHLHPKASEWVIVSDGKFQVRLEKEKRIFDLQHQAIVIYFPPKQKHALSAISAVSYLVLRDKNDMTIYCNNPL